MLRCTVSKILKKKKTLLYCTGARRNQPADVFINMYIYADSKARKNRELLLLLVCREIPLYHAT